MEQSRKLSLLLLFCISIFISSASWADPGQSSNSTFLAQANATTAPVSSQQDVIESSANQSTSTKDLQPDNSSVPIGPEIPDWLKRTDYGAQVGTGETPSYYLETVQPLYQSDDKVNTVFTHDRFSDDESGTFSGGLGYRRLLFDNNLMVGINSFFDYQDSYKEYRQGVGLEAITKTLEFRTNAYFDLSPKRVVSDDVDTTVFEKVVNGGDVEIGAPLPFIPWIKIFAGYQRYAYHYASDLSGAEERVEFSPFKFATVNFVTSENVNGGTNYQMDGRVSLQFEDFTLKSLRDMFSLAPTAYPDVDLTTRTLDRVERNFHIQTERWSTNKTTGVTVEISRT